MKTMTDKSIFKFVVLAFFITFSLATILFLIAGLLRIAVGGTAGTFVVAGGVSHRFVRLTLIGTTVGVVVITYLLSIWRKLKR
jgi:uncharacterized membrane protein